MIDVVTKDPNDTLDYEVDFARWLPEADTVAGATVLIEGTVTEAQPVDLTATMVRVWLQGGAAGETATITVRATTAGARVKDFTFKLRIKES